MCLDKPIKGADLSGEKKGYKIFVKANDKLYPYAYNTGKQFMETTWNVDESYGTIFYDGYYKRYNKGYHFFRDKNKAIEQFKSMHAETLAECMKDPGKAISCLRDQFKSPAVELCLFAVKGRDVVAYGRQFKGKRCYVAKQIMIYSQVMSLPVIPGLYKDASEQL